jgi:hypothetical protein
MRRSLLLVAVVAVGAVILVGCLPRVSFYHTNVPWDAGPNLTTQSQTFRIGPFDLTAMNTPGWEVLGNRSMPRPAGNVAIKSIDFAVVKGDGTPIGLDLVHLHHIVLLDQSQPDVLCPNVGARFAGTGTERTKLRLDGSYAYRADAGAVWGSTFHVHTTSATPSPDTYIQYTVAYQPITDPVAFRFTTPYFLDVTGCWENSASLYDVPGGGGSGSEHVATATYPATRNGTAVWAGGHIHAGGKNISVTRNGTEDYCTATASYAPGGHPNHPNLGQLQKISSCKLHSEVKIGDQFVLRSRYDNEFPVLKAMGIMLVHVWHPPGS